MTTAGERSSLEAAAEPARHGRYATPAPAAAIERTRLALEHNGFVVFVVDSCEAACAKALELIPDGASVGSGCSATLDEIGFTEALIASGHFDRFRALARLMDRDHVALGGVIRERLEGSDCAVGSANAVTEDGSLIFGSMTGSQLGPYVSSAGRVFLIVGAQKIVPDLETGLRRLREYVVPLERERVRKASGAGDTRLNDILILSGTAVPGRITVVLVREAAGF